MGGRMQTQFELAAEGNTFLPR